MRMDKDGKVEFCLDWIRKIQSLNKTYNKECQLAEMAYKADPSILAYPQDTSKVTTTDLMDTIEWVKPSILNTFTGGEDLVSLIPMPGDEKSVKDCELLVNYQVQIKNDWYKIFNDWLDDACKFKMGVVKYQWVIETKSIERDYEDLDDLEYQAKISEPNIEIIEHNEVIVQEPVYGIMGDVIVPLRKKHTIRVRYFVEDQYPLLEAIPIEGVGFPIEDTKEIKETPFFYQRVYKRKHEIIKQYGRRAFDRIKDTCRKFEEKDALTIERFRDLGEIDFLYNKERDLYCLYECYYYDSESGDARLAVIIGETLLVDKRNQYEKPPFNVLNIMRRAHSVCGYSFYDLLREIQRIRTFMLREFINHVAHGNRKRAFVDVSKQINIEDYKDNRPGVLIRMLGDVNSGVREEIKAPLPQEYFPIMEMLNTEKDYHSGVPRSFQGINPRILNKTWRGQNQQINQASQRVEMMANLIAMTAITPLIEDVIDLNLKFLNKKTAVRYLDRWVEVNPDNILGKYDLVINVGVSTSKKDTIISQMQQLLALFSQTTKAGVQVVTPQNVYNVLSEIIKAMGFKNVTDFITPPPPPQIQSQTPLPPSRADKDMAAMIGRMVPRQPMNPESPPVMGEEMMAGALNE